MPPSPAPRPSPPSSPDLDGSARGIRDRISRFWERHRRLFWTLHSGWALATGVAVVFLARERYGFVPWVVAFLFVTWASTLFFGSRASGDGSASTPGLGEEVTSYATRTLYQETLFFLLPLYAHSTVVGSANVVFVAFLGGLALFSCLDLVFDRWLRTRPAFGMVFFATVAFAALNLLLPMLLGLDPRFATPVAVLAAVGSAAPLALRVPFDGLADRVKVGVLGVALPAVILGVPSLIPAVPLYTERAALTSRIDREDLTLGEALGSEATVGEVGDAVYVLFQVLAPSNVPALIQIVWSRDGRVVRTTRDIEILAHDWGFRVWDGYRPGQGRPVPPGDYVAEIQTRDGRIFGRTGVEIR